MNLAESLLTLSDLPGPELTQRLARLTALRQRLRDIDDERAEVVAEMRQLSAEVYVLAPDELAASNV